MVCRERASALVNDVWVLEVVLVAGVDKGVNGIVDILLNAVVHRVAAGAVACSVIVHAESASDVNQFDVIAHLAQLHIELGRLAQGILDAANHGHLAADVEMDELEAVDHVVLFEIVEGGEEFAGVESELASVSPTLFPFTAAAAGELDAYAYVGFDVQAFSYLVDENQLVKLLHDEEDAPSHLLCEQGEFDVSSVLVSVADDG